MQTVLSPADTQRISIEKLIQIPIEKVKGKLVHLGAEERIRYAGALFEGNGWTVAYHNKGKTEAILLSYPKSPDNIVLMVRLDAREQELSYEQVREHLLYFENELAPQYQCSQFCLIAFNGYNAKAEHLEDFNLLLQKWSYIEELHLNHSKDNVREPRIQLFAHNKQTYKKVQRMMQQTNAVAVVQATGTGKSYLIAKLLQDFNRTKRLVMAPSTFIIEQIKEHIRWEVEKIQFMTYAKGMNLSESEVKELQPGLIVLDEFHRCGADEWGRGVQNILNAYPNAFKFGTSATPIRYLDNRRDMAKELFEGHIAENLSLAQAITRNILPMPKYVCALYTLKEEADNMRELIKKSRKNEEAKRKLLLELDTLTLDWEKSHGIPQVIRKHWRKHMTKFIVFCENEKHLLETEPMVVGWFKEALRHSERSEESPNQSVIASEERAKQSPAQKDLAIKTYRIYDNESSSNENLEAFKNASDKETIHLLFSINMLNEGLHVNEVSGVVLLRPTESPNIFYQQIGRCLKVGMNHAPVIFDFVNNFKSVRTHEFLYDLQEAKRFHADTRKEQDLKDLCPEFSIIDEVREITEVFGEIEFKVQDWEVMYERLVEFKKRFGNCDVPNEWEEDKTLARWLRNQRRAFKLGILEKENANRLTELGIEWKSDQILIDPDELWMRRFNELSEFRKQYGHLNPRRDNKKNKALESFIRLQRHIYKSGKMKEYRVKLLESIGFEWSAYQFEEGRWQQYFDELTAFKTQNGHCNVSIQSGMPLAQWVFAQREAFKYNSLDPGRKRLLDSIGFIWIIEKTDKPWNEWFEALRHYYMEHETSLVDRNSKQSQALSNWCSAQRAKRKKGLLTQAQIDQLNSLNFKWNVLEEIWEERFAELTSFKDKFGHCRVPQLDKQYRTLAIWCGNVRKSYNGNTLTAERIKRLESLGFSWNIMEEQWQNRYEELKQFLQQHPFSDLNDENKSLSYWVTHQRNYFRDKSLSQDKINLLNKLGFEWSPLKDMWNNNFRELLQFKEKHGLSYVPITKEFKKYNKLAIWCASQRNAYKNNELTPDQLQALQSVDFPWTVERTVYTGPRMDAWMAAYKKLLQFKKQFGLSHVPRTKEFKAYGSLGAWCTAQRTHHRFNRLIPQQIQLLNDIGFPWQVEMGPGFNEELWNVNYKKLLAYRKKYRKNYVTQYEKGYESLGSWCSAQRVNYRDNKLPPAQVQLLNDIGFPWVVKSRSPDDKKWHAMYEELVKYNRQHGKSWVAELDKEHRKLGGWCKTQRRFRKENRLLPERIKLLDNIDFPWEGTVILPKDIQWKAMYNKLVNYRQKYGKTKADKSDKQHKSLYAWCIAQGTAYRRNKLAPERIKMLNDIGFSWEKAPGGKPNERLWNTRYAELVKFRNEFGHTRVRKIDKERHPLYLWCQKQRASFRKNQLTPHHIQLLNDIGFVWNP